MWQPSSSPANLRFRAQLLANIRQFFAEREVMEVETPLLCQGIGTDPHLDFFSTELSALPRQQTLYLQTSPEFAMKRMLAAGCGSIYQICKAFRKGETGRYHNPEFTLLEWYQVGFDLPQLMDEITALLQSVLKAEQFQMQPQRYRYVDVFKQYTGLDALRFSISDYQRCAEAHQFHEALQLCGEDHATWLDFLFSHLVQPHLGKQGFCLVYEYPACQAALARIKNDNPLVAERVELFMQGIELGNGYYELIDPVEQEQRFDGDIQLRRQHNLCIPDKDQRFLAALKSGLPACAGMAIGLDRLLMILCASTDIEQVLAFKTQQA